MFWNQIDFPKACGRRPMYNPRSIKRFPLVVSDTPFSNQRKSGRVTSNPAAKLTKAHRKGNQMSEDTPKIQTTAPDALTGGQHPLTERRGNEAPVGSLGFCRGVNVEASSAPYQGKARNDLNLTSQVSGRELERAKPVDRRTIQGSTPGDSRLKPGDTAAASLRQAANGEGVRGPVGQTPNGKRDATLGSFSKDHADGSYPVPDNGD
jgi:hypothetical protein